MKNEYNNNIEVALVGDFQCGKSTFFNMLCGGREIAPRGCGVKTSSCAVSVCQNNDDVEYAELEWYTHNELAIRLEFMEKKLDGTDKLEFERIKKLIKSFAKDLPNLQSSKKIGVKAAASLLSYPKDWELRWEREPRCGGYLSVQDLSFFFLKRVVFHLNVVLPVDCVFTDTPGFNAGIWDLATARDTMRRSSVILCVMNGREKTVPDTYFKAIDWLKEEGLSFKLFFAVNAKSYKQGEAFAGINQAKISRRGFKLNQNGLPVFSALLSYMSRSSGFSKGDVGRAIAEWMDFDIIEDKDKIAKLLTSQKKIEKVINMPQLLSALKAFADQMKKAPPQTVVSREGLVNSSQGLVPDIGYAWLNPSDPHDMRVKWVPGICMPNHPHVVAGTKVKEWNPEEGYVWSSDASGDFRVYWNPGKPYKSSSTHIVAGKKEGIWVPEDGYSWVDATNKTSQIKRGVRWCPGCAHPTCSGVVAASDEGFWKPKEGYRWADESSTDAKWRYGCVWSPGMAHSEIAHVVASHTVGDWEPEPGYKWKNWLDWLFSNRTPTVNQKLSCGVIWWSGTSYPGRPHVVADKREGYWTTEDGWRFVNPGTSDLSVRPAVIGERINDFLTNLFS